VNSFPRLLARTQGFRLGRPVRFTLAPDGRRLLFLRSLGGEDPVRRLWILDVATGEERLLADPLTLGAATAAPSAQERTRRERARDRSSGIGDYTTDQAVRVVAFTASEGLHVVSPDSGEVTALPARTPLTGATLSPDGRTVAYVSGGGLRVIGVDGSGDRALASPEDPERPTEPAGLERPSEPAGPERPTEPAGPERPSEPAGPDRSTELADPEVPAGAAGPRRPGVSGEPDVTYGLAEHVAAESMGRYRGFWWSPCSDRLAVARVDNGPVQTWYLVDPSRPGAVPAAHRYPTAGTPNADVTLWIVDLDGARVEVRWDRAAFEYLVRVVWDAHGLLVVVQDRAQKRLRMLTVDPATGDVTTVAEATDPAWTQIVPGVPARLATGQVIWTVDAGSTRHLTVDGAPVTPAALQVFEVLGVDGDTVLFGASDEPTEQHLWTWSAADGLQRLTSEPGRHSGHRAGGVTVVDSGTLSGGGVTVRGGDAGSRTVSSGDLSSPVVAKVSLIRAGGREVRTAVLLPTGWQGERLPVLVDSYGGPAGQRAVADRRAYYASQWFADQGFAVVVADGRGTPGRGPAWERAVYLNRADPLLEDQIEALHAVAARHPEVDLGRVGIRGWSAGGYLAALAVLRRPDVFHAAVAGAPVTDHLLYDTHWQERFFGDPRVDSGPYERASLIEDAPRLERPLMLIHGFLDDNVFPVHTMRLSAALVAAGRPHTVLPLPGASHMASDVDLLTPQLLFFRSALGIDL